MQIHHHNRKKPTSGHRSPPFSLNDSERNTKYFFQASRLETVRCAYLISIQLVGMFSCTVFNRTKTSYSLASSNYVVQILLRKLGNLVFIKTAKLRQTPRIKMFDVLLASRTKPKKYAPMICALTSSLFYNGQTFYRLYSSDYIFISQFSKLTVI